MVKITPRRITDQFEDFVADLKDSFWGDMYGRAQLALKKTLEAESERARDACLRAARYERTGEGRDHRNGYYERDWVTRFGTVRLRIARTRKQADGLARDDRYDAAHLAR